MNIRSRVWPLVSEVASQLPSCPAPITNLLLREKFPRALRFYFGIDQRKSTVAAACRYPGSEKVFSRFSSEHPLRAPDDDHLLSSFTRTVLPLRRVSMRSSVQQSDLWTTHFYPAFNCHHASQDSPLAVGSPYDSAVL